MPAPRVPSAEEMERIQESMNYRPSTGQIIWKTRPGSHFESDSSCRAWNTRFSGRPAGGEYSYSASSYLQVMLDRRPYKQHRVAWFLHYGEWPNMDIDHIDGDGTNNAINNLRLVKKTTNQRNRKLSKNNTSGTMGVRWSKRAKKWVACIYLHGKPRHLGSFSEYDDAVRARKKAEVDHGFHENHGR